MDHLPFEQGMAEPFAQFRLKQLVGVSKPVGLIGVGIGSTAMLRSTIAGIVSRKGLVETMVEVLNVAVYPFLLSLPAAMVHSGRPDLLQPACVLSHLIRSWALWCVGIGLAPNAEAIRTILHLRIELVLEVALAFQDQMSLPMMAILHALRQAGWMSILVWCMDADPLYTFLRGVCNWLVMMLLACAFEARTWTAYQRHCRALQQQAALPPRPLPQLDQQLQQLPQQHPQRQQGQELPALPGSIPPRPAAPLPLPKPAVEWDADDLPTAPTAKPFKGGTSSNEASEWQASAYHNTSFTVEMSPHTYDATTFTTHPSHGLHTNNTSFPAAQASQHHLYSSATFTGQHHRHGSLEDLHFGCGGSSGAVTTYSQPLRQYLMSADYSTMRGSSLYAGSDGAMGSDDQVGHVPMLDTSRWLQPPDSEPMLSNLSPSFRSLELSARQSTSHTGMLSAETLHAGAAHSCEGSLEGLTRQDHSLGGGVNATTVASPAAAAAAAATALGSRASDGPLAGAGLVGAGKAGGIGAAGASAGSMGGAGIAGSADNTVAVADNSASDELAVTPDARLLNTGRQVTKRQEAEQQHQPGTPDCKSGSRSGVGVGTGAAWFARPAEPQPQHLQTARNVMQVIEQQRRMVAAYTRNSRHTPRTVNVKIKGVELEQLPANMSALLQQQLLHSMPGIMMAGVALRNGCIMLTLDLLDLRRYLGLTPTVGPGAIKPGGGLASSMMEVITRIMPHMDLAQLLEDGTAMCIQTPDEVMMCHWDADKATYHAVGGASGPLNAALDPSALALPIRSLLAGPASNYHLLSATPAVHVLPDGAAGPLSAAMHAAAATHVGAAQPPAAGSSAAAAATATAAARHQLTLSVELQLPSNCRLDGWQPTSGDSSGGGGGGSVVPGTPGSVSGSQRSSCDGPIVDAMLLARRLGGGYLPVVIKRESRTHTGSATTRCTTTAEVLIALEGAAPASLCLELWYKKPTADYDTPSTIAAGMSCTMHAISRRAPLELLVSHMPLLVLPASCRAAAVELEQHMDHVGGVRPRQVLPIQPPALVSNVSPAFGVTDRTSIEQPSFGRAATDITDAAGAAAPPASDGQLSFGVQGNASMSDVPDRLGLRSRIISAPDNVQIEPRNNTPPVRNPFGSLLGFNSPPGTPNRLPSHSAYMDTAEELCADNPLALSAQSTVEFGSASASARQAALAVPVSAMPDSEAADDDGDGPACLLEDLGMWLTHHHGHAGSAADVAAAGNAPGTAGAAAAVHAASAAGMTGLAAVASATDRAGVAGAAASTAADGAGVAGAAGSAAADAPGVAAMAGAAASAMHDVGLDLLIYAVQHGLKAVAALIANTMQRAELQDTREDMAGRSQSSTPQTGAEPRGPSAWFLRAVQCGTATTGDAGDQSTAASLHDGTLGGVGTLGGSALHDGTLGGVRTLHDGALHDDALGGDGGGVDGMGVLSSRMGLLHAAMISGQPTVLAQVLRWGTLYGGVGWSWPWAQEDGSGLHALHLAATQPSGVCAALLETIMWALPPEQAEVARGVWLHGQGGVGAAPAALFAVASPHANLSMIAAVGRAAAASHSPAKCNQAAAIRAEQDSITEMVSARNQQEQDGVCPAAPVRQTSQGEVSSSYDSRASGSGSTGPEQASKVAAEVDKASKVAAEVDKASKVAAGLSKVSTTSSSASSGVALASAVPAGAAPVATPAAAPTGVVREWLGSVAAVWMERETDEYRAWVKSQMSSVIRSWAATMAILFMMCSFRSAMMGCLVHDLPHLTIHTICYLPVAAAVSGVSWLGNWQAWMLITHVFHSLGYLLASFKRPHEALVWAAIVHNWSDVIYTIVLAGAMDQTPLPQALVGHLVRAYFHGLAYASAGVSHPLTRALCVHASALLVTTLSRTWQRRNYLHWKHNAQQQGQASGVCAAGLGRVPAE